MEIESPYRQLLEDLRAAADGAGPASNVVVDRAAAMLAGRVGCRIGEARGHLVRMATEQDRDVTELAGEVIAVLESDPSPIAGRVRSVTNRLFRRAAPAAPAADAAGPRAVPDDGTGPLVQQVLDALPGSLAWLAPVRAEATNGGPGDGTGEVTDFVLRAASAEAVDIAGRQGSTMVGVSVRAAYPATTETPLWQAYLDTLADGAPRQLGPLDFPHETEGVQARGTYSVRVHRVGAGLLVNWIRHDEGGGGEALDRLARTERLAGLGWGEWDLRTGEVTWSDELYRIYERDPGLGPLSREESAALMHPDDVYLRTESAASFARGERVDITYRIRLNGRVKHLRAVIDAVRDAQGQPLRLYGIVQDVTSRELARARLATVERQLREHQATLRAEHQLAAQLQQIVLPIPATPLDLPGLRVALRYLPAERASRVGGDWYHAAAAPDGTVLLAVGDVAGHGLAAATTMAQLRHVLAALAITMTTDPAELLSHLNRLLCASEATAATATAAIARYDPATAEVTWAQAGHPPPLRARAGVTSTLTRPRGPLLGAVPDAVYENTTIELQEHELLLFYTDGLVEDRHRSLEEGLAPVMATLNEISAAGTEAPLADLLDRLHRANPDDDTCVLAARLLPMGGAS